MWMMGYNDGGELNMPDSFNGRKLRPLIPRPMSSTNNNTPTTSRLHGTDLFSLNHQHLATMADQSKRDFHTQPLVVSSRWNPTPEQLRTLEELYRRGTRTPSADQIQHITAQLRRYGKIEGKNVFYWFQNHKARERQKRRRQMESNPPDENIESFERKESGSNRTCYEGEQAKNWVPSTNCSTLSEETGLIQTAAKGVAGCRADGWVQFDEGEFQNRRSNAERNATWQMMQFTCPSSHRLINTPITKSTTTPTTIPTSPPTIITTTAMGTTTTTTPPPTTTRTMDKMRINTCHDLNILLAPYYRENGHVGGGLFNHFNNNNGSSLLFNNEEDVCGDSQTLQLFPLRSCCGGDHDNENINEKDAEISIANFSTPCQFFEFLPLKN